MNAFAQDARSESPSAALRRKYLALALTVFGWQAATVVPVAMALEPTVFVTAYVGLLLLGLALALSQALKGKIGFVRPNHGVSPLRRMQDYSSEVVDRAASLDPAVEDYPLWRDRLPGRAMRRLASARLYPVIMAAGSIRLLAFLLPGLVLAAGSLNSTGQADAYVKPLVVTAASVPLSAWPVIASLVGLFAAFSSLMAWATLSAGKLGLLSARNLPPDLTGSLGFWGTEMGLRLVQILALHLVGFGTALGLSPFHATILNPAMITGSAILLVSHSLQSYQHQRYALSLCMKGEPGQSRLADSTPIGARLLRHHYPLWRDGLFDKVRLALKGRGSAVGSGAHDMKIAVFVWGVYFAVVLSFTGPSFALETKAVTRFPEDSVLFMACLVFLTVSLPISLWRWALGATADLITSKRLEG